MEDLYPAPSWNFVFGQASMDVMPNKQKPSPGNFPVNQRRTSSVNSCRRPVIELVRLVTPLALVLMGAGAFTSI